MAVVVCKSLGSVGNELAVPELGEDWLSCKARSAGTTKRTDFISKTNFPCEDAPGSTTLHLASLAG